MVPRIIRHSIISLFPCIRHSFPGSSILLTIPSPVHTLSTSRTLFRITRPSSIILSKCRGAPRFISFTKMNPERLWTLRKSGRYGHMCGKSTWRDCNSELLNEWRTFDPCPSTTSPRMERSDPKKEDLCRAPSREILLPPRK